MVNDLTFPRLARAKRKSELVDIPAFVPCRLGVFALLPASRLYGLTWSAADFYALLDTLCYMLRDRLAGRSHPGQVSLDTATMIGKAVLYFSAERIG